MRVQEYMSLLCEGKFDEAEKSRQSTIPEKLIKFIWLDGSETDEKKFKTLEDEKIWFSAKRFLNDPYEFKGLIIDRQKFKTAGYSDDIIESFEKMIDLNEFGITCFSANATDYLPMWAYYTNNHKGFCVEYELTEKTYVHEVLYETERIKIASLLMDYGTAIEKFLTSKKRTAEVDFLGTMLPIFRKRTIQIRTESHCLSLSFNTNIQKGITSASIDITTVI